MPGNASRIADRRQPYLCLWETEPGEPQEAGMQDRSLPIQASARVYTSGLVPSSPYSQEQNQRWPRTSNVEGAPSI